MPAEYSWSSHIPKYNIIFLTVKLSKRSLDRPRFVAPGKLYYIGPIWAHTGLDVKNFKIYDSNSISQWLKQQWMLFPVGPIDSRIGFTIYLRTSVKSTRRFSKGVVTFFIWKPMSRFARARYRRWITMIQPLSDNQRKAQSDETDLDRLSVISSKCGVEALG